MIQTITVSDGERHLSFEQRGSVFAMAKAAEAAALRFVSAHRCSIPSTLDVVVDRVEEGMDKLSYSFQVQINMVAEAKSLRTSRPEE